MTSPAAPEETGKIKGNHKLLAGLALALGVVLAVVLLFGQRGLYQIYRFRQDRLGLEQENARLAAENARLARTIDRLQHDPEMIQDLIRRELNFVKKNEIIFQLPPAAGQEKPPLSPDHPTVAPPAAPRPKAGPAARGAKKKVPGEAREGAPKKVVQGQSQR